MAGDEALPPQDFAAFKALIAARANSLPRRLVDVASFVLDHPDEIAFGTVSSIAAQAGVQPSALVRFSQALGYQGFSEMQELFRGRLRDKLPHHDARLRHLKEQRQDVPKPRLILQGFSAAASRSLASLQERVEDETLDRAVNALAAAETIYLLGLRRSFPIAAYMAYALARLSVRAQLIDAVGGLAAEQIDFAGPGDAVLAISFSPYAAETVSLVRAAAAKFVPVIAITDSAFSPLAQLGQPWLEVSEADFEGFRSMAATLTLAMTLTVAIAERRQRGA